jgi:ferredoxin
MPIKLTFFIMADDLDLPGMNVMVKDHDCGDHMEKLYYACEYEDACIYCGAAVDGCDDDDATYPQCDECDEVPIQKR